MAGDKVGVITGAVPAGGGGGGRPLASRRRYLLFCHIEGCAFARRYRASLLYADLSTRDTKFYSLDVLGLWWYLFGRFIKVMIFEIRSRLSAELFFFCFCMPI